MLLTIIKKELLAHIDMEENEIFKLAKAHLSQEKAQEMQKAFELEKERIKGK